MVKNLCKNIRYQTNDLNKIYRDVLGRRLTNSDWTLQSKVGCFDSVMFKPDTG